MQDLVVAIIAIGVWMFGVVIGAWAVYGAASQQANEQEELADQWRDAAVKAAQELDELQAELARLRDEQRQAGERRELLAILKDEPGAAAVEPAATGMEAAG